MVRRSSSLTRLHLEALEDRCNPSAFDPLAGSLGQSPASASLVPADQLAATFAQTSQGPEVLVGAGAGVPGGHVRLFDGKTGIELDADNSHGTHVAGTIAAAACNAVADASPPAGLALDGAPAPGQVNHFDGRFLTARDLSREQSASRSGDGNDILIGGWGDDWISGGTGQDAIGRSDIVLKGKKILQNAALHDEGADATRSATDATGNNFVRSASGTSFFNGRFLTAEDLSREQSALATTLTDDGSDVDGTIAIGGYVRIKKLNSGG